MAPGVAIAVALSGMPEALRKSRWAVEKGGTLIHVEFRAARVGGVHNDEA
jgi:hypothetical protein